MGHKLWEPCRKAGISPNTIYFLDCCRQKIVPGNIINTKAESSIALSKGLIDDKGILTEKAVGILDEFEVYQTKISKKVSTDILGENFEENIKIYREMFPSGKLPSGKFARQTVQELRDKFIKFFKMYPQFDWVTILDATDHYIQSTLLDENKKKFMICSSYFILKTEKDEKKSTLADYCQEIVDNPEFIKHL
jgi:hypothetical protein